MLARAIWFIIGMMAGAESGHNVWLIGTFFTLATWFWTIFHVFTHELSHALTAQQLGNKVTQVAIGRGETFMKAKLFGLPFVFNIYLSQGGVTFYEDTKIEDYVQRDLYITLAGPLADIALVILLLPFCGDGYNLLNVLRFNDGPQYIACSFVLIQLASLFKNLIPWGGTKSVSLDGIATTASDGHQIFDTLLLKDKTRERSKAHENYRQILESYDTGESIPHNPKSEKAGFAYTKLRFFSLIQKNEIEYAEAIMEWAVEHPDFLKAEKILYLDVLASQVSSNREAFPYRKKALENWIERALEIQGGTSITLRVTKGILLILNDRYEQGEAILSRYATESKIQHDRFGSCLFMAVSRSWQSDFESAKSWLAKARADKTNQETYESALQYIRNPPKDGDVKRAAFKGSFGSQSNGGE